MQYFCVSILNHKVIEIQINMKKTLLLLTFSIALIALSFTEATRQLPDVNVRTLDGKSINIQEYAKNGKITVISFWATWCAPCKRELDAISELYPEWTENYDVEVLAISTDNARALSKVRPLVEQKGWEFEVLSDSKQELQRALNFQAIPQTFLINQAGEIVSQHEGYKPGDEYHLEDEIKKLSGK